MWSSRLGGVEWNVQDYANLKSSGNVGYTEEKSVYMPKNQLKIPMERLNLRMIYCFWVLQVRYVQLYPQKPIFTGYGKEQRTRYTQKP